jgi:hypothetical protein
MGTWRGTEEHGPLGVWVEVWKTRRRGAFAGSETRPDRERFSGFLRKARQDAVPPSGMRDALLFRNDFHSLSCFWRGAANPAKRAFDLGGPSW